jgi:hypothetical protein
MFLTLSLHPKVIPNRLFSIPKPMKQIITASLIALLSATVLSAQSVPTGWRERIDRSTSAEDPDSEGDVKLLTAGSGFHIETPSAAVFWHPSNSVTGNYTLRGSFTLNEPSGHTNFYGLIFGGSGLDGAAQKYTYFMVAQNGAWLIKTRDGDATTTTFAALAGAARNGSVVSDAVQRPGADGKSVNNLEVRVQASTVEFVVNGTVVHSAPKAGLVTDGLWGVRSNHLLNINVADLGVVR